MVRLAVLLLCCLTLAVGARAGADDAARCDMLASEDPAVAPVVALAAIEPAPALAACAAAVQAAPGTPRYLHQYARALERAGRLDDALRLYRWAAEDGYAPAAAALQRLAGTPLPAPAELTAAEREQMIGAMAALSAALRRTADALPPDPADPIAILAQTGPAPDAILAWVAGGIRLVPYVGSLRGPAGVLTDRAGNSLDRALALTHLLSFSGHEVRLARTTLTTAQSEALLAALPAGVPLPQLPPPTRDTLVASLGDSRIDPAIVAAAADEAVAEVARAETLLATRTEALLPALLAAAGPAAGAADAAARTRDLAALRDYFWVQLRVGTTWQDLMPDAAVLGALTATATFAAADLPESLRHAVTIRVVVEIQDAAGRREEPLLNWTGHPADVPVETLVLSHSSPGFDGIEQMLSAGNVPARVLEVLDGIAAWTPILRVGGELIVERLFTADGRVADVNLSAFAATGGAVRGLFADVGTVLGGGDLPAARIGIPTAEWIEIEVRVPGEPPRIERRTVFDLVGPAARAAGAAVVIDAADLRDRALRLAGVTDVLVVGATPSQAAVARTSAIAVADVADRTRAYLSAPDQPLADLREGPRIPLPLLAFASERLADSPGLALASPNVFLLHDRFAWTPAGAMRQAEFDIVFNAVTAREGPFAASVRQGLVDTILEDALVSPPATANVSALHAADVAASRLWRPIVAPATGPRGTPPDAATRIAATLASGAIVVAPSAVADPARLGWWRIDPATGTTLGILAPGGGAAFVEAALEFAEGVASVACFVRVGLTIAAMVGGPRASPTRTQAMCLLAGGLGLVGTGLGAAVGFASLVELLTLRVGASVLF